MKKIKKLLTIGLAVLLMLCSIVLSGCSDKKYQVSQEEYEKAFSIETLKNVTISMTGPYRERDHIKSYFYSVGNDFALCSYNEDTQYYGRYYGIENGEEFCYLYGSERLADFTEKQAVWTKCDNPSAYSDKGVEFVTLYKRDFHLLEYDKSTKSYNFEFIANGQTGVYSYYFTDKKLTKFVITNEADNYEYIWEFYDYGTTVIPVKIDDIETSDKSIISLSPEIESQFDLSQEKIGWISDTSIDFADDKILIIFKKTTTYPKLSIEDFTYENAESIEYMFLRPTDGNYENVENYKQIAEINLKEKGRDKVIEAVRYFERISIILYAQPIYIYGIGENIKNESLTEKDLENIAILKECYSAKYPNGGQAFVVNYYGKYGNAIVAMMSCTDIDYPAVEWTEIIAEQEFVYDDGNSIVVLYDGEFYSLANAYSKNYLTQENISDISIKHIIFRYFSVIQ